VTIDSFSKRILQLPRDKSVFSQIIPIKLSFNNGPHVKFAMNNEYHSIRLAQEIYEVNMVKGHHEPLEQVNTGFSF
jgi:hypothetical protein